MYSAHHPMSRVKAIKQASLATLSFHDYHCPTAGLLNVSITDILGHITVMGAALCIAVFSNIPGLLPLDVSSTSRVVTTKNVWRDFVR